MISPFQKSWTCCQTSTVTTVYSGGRISIPVKVIHYIRVTPLPSTSIGFLTHCGVMEPNPDILVVVHSAIHQGRHKGRLRLTMKRHKVSRRSLLAGQICLIPGFGCHKQGIAVGVIDLGACGATDTWRGYFLLGVFSCGWREIKRRWNEMESGSWMRRST